MSMELPAQRIVLLYTACNHLYTYWSVKKHRVITCDMYLYISEVGVVARTVVHFLQEVKDENTVHKRNIGSSSCYIHHSLTRSRVQDTTHLYMPRRAKVT